MIWLIFARRLVLVAFVWWERRRIERGEGALIDPAMLRNLQLRSGVMSFLFMFLIQAGIFFTVPLFLSVALGISAVETGVRLLPLSLSLLLFAVGVPRLRPNASPRRVVRLGFIMLFSGLVLLVALLDVGAGPEIVTWPLLLAGLRARDDGLAARRRDRLIGTRRAKRRGRRAPEHRHPTRRLDRHRTRRRGAHLRHDRLVLHRFEHNPKVPDSVVSQAHTQLAAGVPFISEADAKAALKKANVPPATADEIVKHNEKSQIDGLRAAEAILALLALIALPFTRGIPTVQPGAQAIDASERVVLEQRAS